MVVGRILRLRAAGATSQRDPLTGTKAIVGLILLYGLFGLLPKEMTNTWLSWAEGLPPLWAGGPRGLHAAWIGFLSAVAAVSLAKAVLDHIFGGSVWKWLRFQPNPKTRVHHTGALIWLHGVGDSGAGFEWLRKEFAELGVSQVKVVLPDAPMRALQAAGGGKKRAWFGLKSMPVSLEVSAAPPGRTPPLLAALRACASPRLRPLAPSTALPDPMSSATRSLTTCATKALRHPSRTCMSSSTRRSLPACRRRGSSSVASRRAARSTRIHWHCAA